jgi:hypothetical protein
MSFKVKVYGRTDAGQKLTMSLCDRWAKNTMHIVLREAFRQFELSIKCWPNLRTLVLTYHGIILETDRISIHGISPSQKFYIQKSAMWQLQKKIHLSTVKYFWSIQKLPISKLFVFRIEYCLIQYWGVWQMLHFSLSFYENTQ